jgi:opacity protein-like surface antigen
VAPKFVFGLAHMSGVKVHCLGSTDNIGNELDSTFGGAFAIGNDLRMFRAPIRAELEFAIFSRAEAEKTFAGGSEWRKPRQSFRARTLFLNGYYDFTTHSRFTPYMGGGLGFAFVSTKSRIDGFDVDPYSGDTSSKMRTNFAWNIGGGLAYDVAGNITLDFGYRLAGLGSVETRAGEVNGTSLRGSTKNLFQHQFLLGLRYAL